MNDRRGLVTALSLAVVVCASIGPKGAGTGPDAGFIGAAQAAPPGNMKPCDRISAADVQPFFTKPVKKRAPTEIDSVNCYFDVIADDGPTLQILLAPADYLGSGNHPPTDDGKPGIALAGIGDRAIRESNDVWVYAWKGNMFCMVHADHSYAQAGDVEMMRGLKLADTQVKKIPAATAQALAEALGTLCNRAFGSGNTVPSFANLP